MTDKPKLPTLPSEKFWNNTTVMMKHWEDTIRADEQMKCNRAHDLQLRDILKAKAEEKAQAQRRGYSDGVDDGFKRAREINKEDIEEIRADEREKIESILKKKFKVDALYEFCNTKNIAEKYGVSRGYFIQKKKED